MKHILIITHLPPDRSQPRSTTSTCSIEFASKNAAEEADRQYRKAYYLKPGTTTDLVIVIVPYGSDDYD